MAAYGDPARAERLFARAGALLSQNTDRSAWRDDFGSGLRDRAAVLTLATEAGSAALDFGALMQSLQPENRSLSTQEAAQVVLAAHALDTADIEVDGVHVSGAVIRRLSDSDPRAVIIHNTSARATDITLTSYGVPEITPFEEIGARLIIDDPLPDGLEIDNPNLLASGAISAFDWLKTAQPQNVEFRSDRFLAARCSSWPMWRAR